MARQDMYPAVNNSVPTTIVGGLSATATLIQVANASVLPAGPNMVTISMEDNAEVVFYSTIEDGVLTGCVRGFGGTVAQVWPEGTMVYRAYTAVDHRRFIENIDDLYAGKADAGDEDLMRRAVYDTNDTGVVDDAEKLGGELPGAYAKKPGEGAYTPGHLYMADAEGNLQDSGIMHDLVVTTAERVLELLKTVDSTGSGLDADLLDGIEGGPTGGYLTNTASSAGGTAFRGYAASCLRRSRRSSRTGW